MINGVEVAEGRRLRETQMILNHKVTIEYLVSGSEEIGFNRPTILGLHALLTDNLGHDSAAFGARNEEREECAGSG